MAQNIYKMSMMLALVLVVGTFAYNFSQTGSVTGNTVIVRYAYLDADMDGYGDPNIYVTNAYRQPAGYVTNNLDCDDGDANQHPGSYELSEEGVDNDCDGRLDISENRAACARA
jgi:hypothetical protein